MQLDFDDDDMLDGPLKRYLVRRRNLKYLPWRIYSRITWFFKTNWRNFTRACAYARLGWNNPDWDHAYFLDMLEFKLTRMYADIYGDNFKDPADDADDDYAQQMKQGKQALRLAVRLAQKLRAESYNWHYTQHERRWGPSRHEFLPADRPGYKIWNVTREKVTPENKQQMEDELRLAFDLDSKVQQRDADWLFGIMAKYYQHWWT